MADQYPFDPSFEATVVALLVTSTRFFNRVGPHIDPARFKDEKSRLIAAEARALYEQIGKPPGSAAVVMQRLRAQHNSGKLNRAKLMACCDYLTEAEDKCDGIDPDVAIHEVAEVLQRLGQQDALDSALTTYAEHGDMTNVAKKIEVVASIGKSDVSYGVGLDGFDEELEAMGAEDRLSTGFRELDVATEGGTARGEFWFWLAGPKVGKSMALVQNAVCMLMRGLHTAVATLELDENKWRARVLGALTGTPYQDILKYRKQSVAFARLRAMQDDPDINLGRLTVHKFAGHQTPTASMFDWVKREEDRTGIKVEGFVADYLDKAIGPDPKASEYLQMRDVYESTRIWTADQGAWAWSASQAVRIEVGEMPTVNSCADSQHKVRVTDGMVGITRLPDDENKVLAKILALRNGSGDGAEAGPVPNGFDFGCFVDNVVPGREVEKALTEGDLDLGIFA